MTIQRKPAPRQNPQAPFKRAPVKKHAQHSVGTLPPGNAFYNPGSKRGTTMALLSQQGSFK
jgi:hypothetical protein